MAVQCDPEELGFDEQYVFELYSAADLQLHVVAADAEQAIDSGDSVTYELSSGQDNRLESVDKDTWRMSAPDRPGPLMVSLTAASGDAAFDICLK